MSATSVGSALSTTGLRKSFGENIVLNGIDLDISEGSVFSLLGPNGAGKTTAVRTFSTLLHPDAGEVSIGRLDLARQPGRPSRAGGDDESGDIARRQAGQVKLPPRSRPTRKGRTASI